MHKALLLATAALVLPQVAMANDAEILPPLPAGATRLMLSETARQDVAQDRVKITLRADFQATTPDEVQRHVNTLMVKALGQTKAYGKIKVSTGSYQVYQRGPKELERWQGSQTLTLDSDDVTQALELAGKLQKSGLLMSGMNFYLSADKQATYVDGLLKTALKKLQARAETVGQALGKPKVELIDVNYNSSQPMQPMMMRASMMMMEKADMGAPAGQQGEAPVTLTVQGTVYLLP